MAGNAKIIFLKFMLKLLTKLMHVVDGLTHIPQSLNLIMENLRKHNFQFHLSEATVTRKSD